MERQRLIYKGRILSDNSRTLADYGIGAGDSGNSADGIIIYLVKGSAANTAAAGGSGGGATTSSGTPASSTNAAPTQGVHNYRGMNFDAAIAAQQAAQQNNPNSMANLMNSMGSMGGMPDMATFQQEMMNNPQMMQEMMNNPMVSRTFSS